MAASGGQRPGGLTALAVLNFIFGSWELLQVLSLAALLGLSQGRSNLDQMPLGVGAVSLLILLKLVEGTLLIISGIGYLGQKHFTGKILGSVYGVVGIISTALVAVVSHQFSFFTILGVLYPLLTLLLLNTTFRFDFISPLDPRDLAPVQPAGRVISPYHQRENHIKLIAIYFAKNNIRGGTGLLFTLVLLSVGLGIAGVFIDAMARDQDRADLIIQQFGEPVAKWAMGADAEQAHFVAHQRPALVSAILIVLIFTMPFLALLGAFNQLAGDIQYKGLRYLLLRTERSNVFFGRFLGTFFFTMIVLAILLAVIFVYLLFKATFYSPALMALWLLQGYAALLLLALPYIALCSWISAAMDSPFVALVISLLIVTFPIIFVLVAQNINENFQYLGYVTPWPLKFKLLHYDPLIVGGTALVMLLFTGVFLGLGMRHFQRRDL